MSKIPSPPVQMESLARCLGGRGSFFLPEEIVYSFNFLFDIFLNSIYLTYVPQFGSENLVYDYLLISQKVSHSVPV